MKTPDEIKKGLEACVAGECNGQGHKCPYRDEGECTSTLAKDALAYIQQLEAKIPRWISAKDRLPDDVKDGDGYCVNYLVYIPVYRSVDIANYIEEADMWVCLGVPVNVTHWMPLPEMPKEQV